MIAPDFSLLTAGEAVFDGLARQVLYSSVIAALVMAVIWTFKIKNPVWQLGLWSLVLLRLVLPPDLSSPVSLRAAFEAAPIELPKIDLALPSASKPTSPPPVTPTPPTPVTDTASLQTEWMERVVDTSPAIAAPVRKPVRHAVSPLPTVAEVAPPAPPSPPMWKALFALLWLVGMGYFAARYLSRLAFYRRLVTDADPVKHPLVAAAVERWRRNFRISRPIRVVTQPDDGGRAGERDGFVSPFTVGLFRPVIFLPRGIVECGSEPDAFAKLIDSVIAHEAAHIRRLDDLWIRLENLIQIAFFFHPAVWLARHAIDLAREKICDRMVVGASRKAPQDYLRGLLEAAKAPVAARQGPRPTFTVITQPEAVPAFNPALFKLRDRIASLKGETILTPPKTLPVAATLAFVAACAMPMAAETQSRESDTVIAHADNGKAKATALNTPVVRLQVVTTQDPTTNGETVAALALVQAEDDEPPAGWRKEGEADGQEARERAHEERERARELREREREARAREREERHRAREEARRQEEKDRQLREEMRELRRERARAIEDAMESVEDTREEIYEWRAEFSEEVHEAISEAAEAMSELQSEGFANIHEAMADMQEDMADLDVDISDAINEAMRSLDEVEWHSEVVIDGENIEGLSDEERARIRKELRETREEFAKHSAEIRERVRIEMADVQKRVQRVQEYLSSPEFKAKLEESQRALEQAFAGLEDARRDAN